MDAKELAIELHDQFCNVNHIDGCSWSYYKDGDDHDWSGHAHQRWLEKAEEVLESELGQELAEQNRLDELVDLMSKI